MSDTIKKAAQATVNNPDLDSIHNNAPVVPEKTTGYHIPTTDKNGVKTYIPKRLIIQDILKLLQLKYSSAKISQDLSIRYNKCERQIYRYIKQAKEIRGKYYDEMQAKLLENELLDLEEMEYSITIDADMTTKEKTETILKIKQHRAKLAGLEQQKMIHSGIIGLASLEKEDISDLMKQAKEE